MAKLRTTKDIWNKTGSGLYILDGTVSDSSVSSSQTYLELKDKARAIEDLYLENAIQLPPKCDLAKIIKDAKIFSDSWLINRIDESSITPILPMLMLNRIADSVLPLRTVPEPSKYLKALKSGSLDLVRDC